MTLTKDLRPEDESLQTTHAINELQSALSKIYPMEKPVTLMNLPGESILDVRLCWKFFRPDPNVVNRLSEAISSFQGSTRWILTGARGGQMCLSTLIKSDMDAEAVSRERPFLPKSMILEMPEFANHIERALNLAGTEPKLFQYDYHIPPLTDAADFWDPGTHTIWVTDPAEIKTEHLPSAQARRLQFALNSEEWRALYADLFGWVSNRHDNQLDPDALRAYPTLSKLTETESEVVEPAEVPKLRAECLRAYGKARDIETFRALNKLVIASNWAIKLDSGLYFRGP